MKIMVMCTGNICRSAMADAFLKNKTKGTDIEIYSCGIYAENGATVPFYTIESMKEYDIDMSVHRATNIRNSNIREMDIILCATIEHKNETIYMYPELKNKVYTMKEYVGLDENGNNPDVKDPWGYDLFIYRKCATEINEITDRIVEKIRKN